MAVSDTLDILARQIGLALEELQAELADEGLLTFAGRLGVGLPGAVASAPAVVAAAGDLGAAAGQLAAADGSEQLIPAIAQTVLTLDRLQAALSEAVAGAELAADVRAQLAGFAEQLAARALDHLVVTRLAEASPTTHAALALAGLLDAEPEPAAGNVTIGKAHTRNELHLDRAGTLLSDPGRHFREVYGWGTDAFDALSLFTRLQRVLLATQAVQAELLTPPGESPLLEAYILGFSVDETASPPRVKVGVRFPGSQTVTNSYPLGDTWSIQVSAMGSFVEDVQALIAAPFDVTLTPPSGTVQVDVTAGLVAAPADGQGPVLLLGQADGTRLVAQTARFAAGFAVTWDAASNTATGEPTLDLEIIGGHLVLSLADRDGFLASFLPETIDVAVDLKGQWRPGTGLLFTGGAALTVTLPLQVEIGPATLREIALTLRVSDLLAVDTRSTAVILLGPVSATVEGLGAAVELRFTRGNLGPLDFGIGFLPPSGLALTVDAGPVTGGGALVFDPGRGLYAGEMQLQFEQISVRAVGLLTTGRSGYSLLVLVSAEFPPVQLGFGFMLVGVGGLLGIHRTVAVEALRAGLKAGALGAVLSPPDPKADPAQLVASLAGLFPPAAGRYVFAPTARIVWGSPVLITIDLCLVLELPSPVRLVALGRMRALLPEEHDPVVRLQVDVLGVIDFGQQTAAVDATLIDSRIAQFTLTGDLALRMSWGPAPVFLLAVGGFHPRFAAPPGFPALDRVAVALASGDNPKLRLEAYLALTSNTVQFGARVDVSARAGSFSIGGFMAFDALVTLSPLAFEVDIAAQLAVKAGSDTLLSISLALTLSGPRPWHAHGRASFSILFFDVSFGFDVTIGDGTPVALPNPVDVAPLLLAALADPRAWTAQLPAGADVVTLRTLDAGTAILAHPLATLQVRQRVAPLDRTLDRFGTSVPSGAARFRITLATVGGVHTTLTPLQDRFAPAQFAAMSDDQKLSAPSFEAMTSGAALGADGYATGAPVTVSVTYEQALVTAEGITPPSHQRLPLPLDVFATLTATTSVPAPAFALRDTP